MYKLRIATIGIVGDNGKRLTVMMPADAVVEVANDALPDGMVEVIWNNQRIMMFAVDLQERGEPVRRGPRKAGPDTNGDRSEAH